MLLATGVRAAGTRRRGLVIGGFALTILLGPILLLTLTLIRIAVLTLAAVLGNDRAERREGRARNLPSVPRLELGIVGPEGGDPSGRGVGAFKANGHPPDPRALNPPGAA